MLPQKLKNFFFNIWNFRKIRKIKAINSKLGKAVSDQEVDRIILKGLIVKMVKKYLRIGAKSDYIPPTGKNHTEIRERILAEFGEPMKKLNVKISDNLKLS